MQNKFIKITTLPLVPFITLLFHVQKSEAIVNMSNASKKIVKKQYLSNLFEEIAKDFQKEDIEKKTIMIAFACY